MDPRLAGANSLADVARFLEPALLLRPLADVATAFPEDDLRAAFFLDTWTRRRQTVGQFLSDKALHRSLPIPYPRVVNALVFWAGENQQGGARALDDASSFAQLLPFVEGTPLAGTSLLEIIPLLAVPRSLRANLTAGAVMRKYDLPGFFREADALSLSPAERARLLSAFKQWLRPRLKTPGGTVAPLRSIPTVASLRARLAALAVPDLEDWTLDMLNPREESPGGPTLSTLLYHSVDLTGLDRRLSDFASLLERLRASPPPHPPLHSDPLLAALQAAARKERAARAATWPYGLGPAQISYVLRDTDLLVRVRPWGASSQREVTLPHLFRWADAPEMKCECFRPACVHRVAALDMLAFSLPEDADLCDTLKKALRPAWERLLDAADAPPASPTRDVGVLSFHANAYGFELRFHAVGKRGVPSKAGKRVHPTAVLEKLDGVDLRLAERFAIAESDARQHGPHFGDAVLLLEGHGRVHWDGGHEPSTVVRVEGTVRVEEDPQGYRLRFLAGGVELAKELRAWPCSDGLVALLPGPDGQLLLVHFTQTFRHLLVAANRYGPVLPKEAAPRLTQLLPGLETRALVELPEELRGDEQAPATRPLIRIQRRPDGLTLGVRTEPLEHGPVFVPGQGVPVSATFDGRRRTFTRRDFAREVADAHAVAGHLGLDPAAAPEPHTWHLDASPASIEVLRRLPQLGVPVEWKGPPVKFSREARLDHLRLAVTRQRDWFGLDGDVEIDGRRVALAALLEAARERRRFVKLADDDYAQLSESLVERLAPIAHLSAAGKPVELSAGAAPLLDALAGQIASLEAAQEWRALMEKLATARATRFKVPRALKAELRDYQREGFEWLSRLAQWGTGAVLADDMGLGKTIQALALLLSRASSGPALVVAPSSVLHTWRTEAARFAPSLSLHLFHEGERTLSGLGAGDVVVVSWTLFAREAEAFAAVRFATLVLDEAHAIKNASTQRAKAAHQVEADFVVALSGTPVENHVGELWSLCRAVMPSLLGSEESFRHRFGAASREALGALATIVRPFILRRTKDAVAKELPQRTDLDVLVPLSAEERALYDDVRLSAVAELGDITGESKRFDVLAALTRLRLCACHPRLVDERWGGAASKLSRLLELIHDLSAADHRVLVFSQFTSHLALVVDALRKDGVAFSYLDGQVPLAERQRRVEAFQKGEGGTVFLVSLKAGGTGLTLTAADYVIHLDPWWNPAVEDQASDRAHRIGQTRPVTVYRLIAEGTIEQQILSLHAQKRELVDALLAGTDSVGKLSTNQLAELIRGGSLEA